MYRSGREVSKIGGWLFVHTITEIMFGFTYEIMYFYNAKKRHLHFKKYKSSIVGVSDLKSMASQEIVI